MEPANAMTTLVSVVTQMTSWFTTMMTALFAEPLFLVVFSVFIVGAFSISMAPSMIYVKHRLIICSD